MLLQLPGDTLQLPIEANNEFYCGGSLRGTKCYYAGKDTSTTKDNTFFKEWAKIIIILPNESSSNNSFHLIVPELFYTKQTFFIY